MKVDSEFIISMTSKLIKINSENPPGREGEIASFVAERLSELGLKTRVDKFGDRANVVGVLKEGEGKKLLFLTHLDTVPAGERENWSVPPFGGIIRSGKIYGRGAADAKGSLASMLGALKALSDAGIGVKGALILAAVADEEVNSKGVKRLLAKGLKADYAIVGEPTDLQVCVAHKGRLVISVRFLGKSVHASAPSLGVNAMYAASEFISKIESISGKKSSSHPLLGSATIAPTMISGGIKDNVIPDEVEVVLDRRTLPGEKPEDVTRSIMEIAEKAAEEKKARARVQVKKWVPPAEIDLSSKLVGTAVETVSELLGVRVRPIGFNATCDMGFLIRAGIPSIILGPGSLEQAHAVDEWISVDELAAAAEIYASIILKFLGKGG